MPCPKEHSAVSDKLPEIVSARLRKQGFYLFLRKPKLDMRCLILQQSTDTNKTWPTNQERVGKSERHVRTTCRN